MLVSRRSIAEDLFGPSSIAEDLFGPLMSNPAPNQPITVVLLGTWARNLYAEISSVADARVQDENRMGSPKKIKVAHSIHPTARARLIKRRRSCWAT